MKLNIHSDSIESWIRYFADQYALAVKRFDLDETGNGFSLHIFEYEHEGDPDKDCLYAVVEILQWHDGTSEITKLTHNLNTGLEPIYESDEREARLKFVGKLEAELRKQFKVLDDKLVVLDPVRQSGNGRERGPTAKTEVRAEVFKRLKDENLTWTMGRVAQEAVDELGEFVTESAVKYVYNQMGWNWERGDRTR